MNYRLIPILFGGKINTMQNNVYFNAALIKIASRCNIQCDYCYMYQHEDQSWREQPKFLAISTAKKIAERINEHCLKENMNEFDIIFHGGEPLLYTAERIIELVNVFKNNISSKVKLSFSIQTNGTLLNEKNIDELFKNSISISISLDGPKSANDLHRLDFNGNSTFEKVNSSVKLLKDTKSDLFSGVIGVIDPRNKPREILEFIDSLDVPKFDFLLPDATHKNQPFLRNENPNIYIDWLNETFELWFREFSHIPIRWFDAILASRVGIPSNTDVMGFGSVCLLVIETDGTYTDHDVLKITQEDGAKLDLNVFTSSIEDVTLHPQIQKHGNLLSKDGINEMCVKCPIVDSCGGGSVPHRYDEINGFNMPSVYCKEICSVISKAAELLTEALDEGNSSNEVIESLVSKEIITECEKWNDNTFKLAEDLKNHFGLEEYNANDIPPAALFSKLLAESDIPFTSKENRVHKSLWLKSIRIQSSEQWLKIPYDDLMEIKELESRDVEYFVGILPLITKYLKAFSPNILEALDSLITDVIVADHKSEDPGIFSFSDDKAPNVLYFSTYIKDEKIMPEDIADSILHEFCHQMLYHLDSERPFLKDSTYPQFSAPWRAGSRPSAGFLHGTFVFSFLTNYWAALYNSRFEELDLIKVKNNRDKFKMQALYGIASLKHFAILTPRGKKLLGKLLEFVGESEMPSLDDLHYMIENRAIPMKQHI